MRLKFLTLLLLLTAEGCALFGPSPPAQPERVLTDYGQLAQRVHAAAWKTDSWSALCEMEYARGGDSQSADAVVLVSQPDRLYLELTGPMGIALGAMAMLDGRLTVNNLHEGWRWEGLADAEQMAGLDLPADSGRQLVAALSGDVLPPEMRSVAVQWNYDARTARYHIEETAEGIVRRWEIDPFNFTVARRSIVTDGITSTVDYAEFHANGPRWVPTVIRLEAHGAALSLDCPTLNLNVPLEDSDFALPPVPGLRLRMDGSLPARPN